MPNEGIVSENNRYQFDWILASIFYFFFLILNISSFCLEFRFAAKIGQSGKNLIKSAY